MQPMLHENRDIVVIQATEEPLKPMDVAFYKRGEQYILHRVISVKDDDYLIRGDNTYVMERVPRDAVIGVLTSFQRKGKTVSAEDFRYRAYARIWNVLYPLRFIYVKTKHLARRVLKKLGLRKERP